MSGRQKAANKGTLYLVGSPIGNLEDVTLRALRVLGEVDLIVAEDTRVARKLLARHGITAKVLSYHEHSRKRRLDEILEKLRSGSDVAAVSDAGMPGISDPGARLVQSCVEAGIPVAVAPGPTALACALAVSGMRAQEFLFLGFLPARRGERRRRLQGALAHEGPIVCYEAPHRVRESLADMQDVLGDRRAVCARELTKRFEEVLRGTLSELVERFAEVEPRGEFTVVVEGAPHERAEIDLADAVTEVGELVEAGLQRSRAVAHVARRRGLPRNRLYRAAVRGREEDS
jgi:16S rRNA (cytidine1402-2'-O)-methyltransferase